MNIENFNNNEQVSRQEPSIQGILNKLDTFPGGERCLESSRKENSEGKLTDMEFKSIAAPGIGYSYSRRGQGSKMDAVYYEGGNVVGGRHLETF